MCSLKLLGSSLFEVDSEIEKILLAFALHGDRVKTVRQLIALRSRNSKNVRAVVRIDSVLDRFRKIKRFGLL